MSAPTIVSPASCPGAAELAAALFSYTWPTSPLGASVLGVNRVLMVIGVTLFVLLARRVSGSTLAALAVGMGLVASPTIADRLDPAHAVMLVLAAAFLLLATNSPDPSPRRVGPPARAWIGVTLTAAVLPATMVPMAAIAAWGFARAGQPNGRPFRQRLGRGLLASASLVMAVTATVFAVPDAGAGVSPFSCALPGSFSPSRTLSFVTGILLAAGPYVWGLTLLGTWTALPRLASSAVVTPLTYAAAPLLAVMWSADSSNALSLPLVLAMWTMAAVGMRAVIHACGTHVGGRVAALIFVLLIPALQLADWRDTLHADTATRGHERLSLEDVGRHLSAIPDGGALVAEETMVDILARVQITWLGMNAPERLIARHPEAVRNHSLAGGVVHALPLAAADLQNRGVAVSSVPGLAGSHRLEWLGGCVTIGTRWRPLPELQRSSSVALVAGTPQERGPAILYAAFGERPNLQPLHWPGVALRGFHPMVYDSAVAADVSRMRADMHADTLAFEEFDRQAPFFARLELFRTPVSPETLVTSLGTVPLRAIAHVAPGQVHSNIQLCPAFPHQLLGFDGEALVSAAP